MVAEAIAAEAAAVCNPCSTSHCHSSRCTIVLLCRRGHCALLVRCCGLLLCNPWHSGLCGHTCSMCLSLVFLCSSLFLCCFLWCILCILCSLCILCFLFQRGCHTQSDCGCCILFLHTSLFLWDCCNRSRCILRNLFLCAFLCLFLVLCCASLFLCALRPCPWVLVLCA